MEAEAIIIKTSNMGRFLWPDEKVDHVLLQGVEQIMDFKYRILTIAYRNCGQYRPNCNMHIDNYR